MQGRSKKRFTRYFNALAACAMAIGLAFSSTSASAADPVSVGVLDEVKLGEGYTKYRNAVEELNQRAKQLEEQLKAREVLNETEGKRFDALIATATLTPAQTTEFAALIKSGIDRRTNYLELTGKATRTETEETLIKDIEGYRKANQLPVNALEDKMFQDLQARERATDKEYIEKANIEVQKVAADKKLLVVVRKDAVAWYSPSVDVTDEVLKRLNRQ